MSDIDSISKKLNITTLYFVLLTFITAGIYPVVWLYKVSKLIKSETQYLIIHPNYYLVVSALIGWTMFLGDAQLVMLMGPSAYTFSMILSKVYFIALIIWAFKAKGILQMYYLKVHGMDIKPNSFYTLIFSIYYINFLINSLPEIKEHHDLIRQAYLNKESLSDENIPTKNE
ncbi:hypothetical protein V5030_09135 [Moellerella wisconsensis]|uniref:hypothetical protein n=1 Tax=Moellerella wisconsensis TaxID=158849 RepID=UPI0030762302